MNNVGQDAGGQCGGGGQPAIFSVRGKKRNDHLLQECWKERKKKSHPDVEEKTNHHLYKKKGEPRGGVFNDKKGHQKGEKKRALPDKRNSPDNIAGRQCQLIKHNM